MSRYSLSLVLILLLGLVSCVSRLDKLGTAQFASDIQADDSKRFTFTLYLSKRANKLNRDLVSQGRQERQTNHRGQNDVIKKNMQDLLKLKFKENQYCRQGYFELDYSYMYNKAELIGECQESATQEDRQKWSTK